MCIRPDKPSLDVHARRDTQFRGGVRTDTPGCGVHAPRRIRPVSGCMHARTDHWLICWVGRTLVVDPFADGFVQPP